MKPGFFITGTGTEVGKTIVAAGLLRSFRLDDIDAVPMKSVQTGGVQKDGKLIAPDLEFCLDVAKFSPPDDERELMAPFVYEPACSPHLAGRMAGRYPDLDHIVACADELSKRHGTVIVEGAGGIMAPLNESETMLDLMKALDYLVLLVSQAGLGTINHTLLSIEALRRAHLKVFGVVFCETSPTSPENRFISDDNPTAVAQFGGVDILGTIWYAEDTSPGATEFWDAFAESLDIEKLFPKKNA